MRKSISVVSAACLVAATCLSAAAASSAKGKSMQTEQTFNFTKTQRVSLNYLLFLPEGYSKKDTKTWPLMLFLHGAGERGSNVWLVAKHGPPKYVETHPDFPFILVSPQCAEGKIWSNDSLLALLDDIETRYAVDRTRVYLTGLSMGGFGTWSLGVAHPDRFAAIVPICGGGERIGVLLSSREKSAALNSLGVWAFHGAKDPVVPLEESQRMVDALKRVGVTDIKLTVYPEAQHDSWTETYNNPELYKWLLEHERK